MNRQPIHRRLTGLICAGFAGLFLIHEARGGYAYLRVVGPPALRFQAVTTNCYVFDPKAFNFEAKLVATASNVVDQLTTPATNETTAVEPAMPVPVKNPQPVVITTGNPVNPVNDPAGNYNFAFPASTASDLLTVTPQMIAEYLKPQAAAGTNQFDRPGTAVFVPVQMPFLPPAAQGTAESRATYQSK